MPARRQLRDDTSLAGAATRAGLVEATRRELRRPGREREWQWHCSPRVRRALEPSRDRKYAHAFVASAFVLCVASQPANPARQASSSKKEAAPGLRSPHPAARTVRPELSSIISLPYVFVLGFLPFARDETIRVHWRAAISSG
uniref:Uncharacterized protein n=1 Tax=Saccharum spontaneum TaxID=62335 RepID=A0A678TQE3_SACSP|nr:hypothetical protein SS16G14_000009 [Saccharum spontaneum]